MFLFYVYHEDLEMGMSHIHPMTLSSKKFCCNVLTLKVFKVRTEKLTS